MYVVWSLSFIPCPFPEKPIGKNCGGGAKLSPYLIAVSLTVFGIENFIHNKLVFIVGAPAYEVPGEAVLGLFYQYYFYRRGLQYFFFQKRWDHHSFVGRLHFFYCGYILWSAALDKYL